MNLLDKMLDFESRSGGDLFLQDRQLFPAFLIAIIDFDQPAGDQATADQSHRDQEIIAHKPAAPRPTQVTQKRKLAKFISPTHKPFGYCMTLPVLASGFGTMIWPLSSPDYSWTCSRSLNHFGRFREHFGRDRYTDLLGGLEVERQIEFGGLHERKFPGFFALKDLIDVFGGAPREIRQINAVTRKPARFDKIGAIVNCRKTIVERGLGDLRNMRIEQRVGENKERARA